tara:strand:- start:7641 stop:8069 length:429 start_codon:yes stop_codon:yes gene_type:complete
MRHIKHSDIGRRMTQYGVHTNCSIDEKIGKSTDVHQNIKCISLAMLEELQKIAMLLAPPSKKLDRTHYVSQGMIAGLNWTRPEPLLEREWWKCRELTHRARNAMRRLSPARMDDINETSLLKIKNCGLSTTAEIMSWKEGQP